jgi:hypothetical protein
VIGFEIVKATTPPKIKPYLEMIFEMIFDDVPLKKYIKKVKKLFFDMHYSEYGVLAGIKSYDDYFIDGTDKIMSWKTGALPQVKGAIAYNQLIKKMKLDSKYFPIFPGGKVKFVYLIPSMNPYGLQSIAYYDKIPEEFGIPESSIDIERMFQKIFNSQVNNIINGVSGIRKERSLRDRLINKQKN